MNAKRRHRRRWRKTRRTPPRLRREVAMKRAELALEYGPLFVLTCPHCAGRGGGFESRISSYGGRRVQDWYTCPACAGAGAFQAPHVFEVHRDGRSNVTVEG